ncbi:MAG: hypothetical protein WCW56_03720 [Candidatus Paceibacterota bacterium]|jgi:hypothetical protein
MATNKREIIREGRQKQRRRFSRVAIIWLVLFLILVVEIILLLRAPKFLINKVEVEGASPYEQVKIKEAVVLALNEKCPCLIPKANIFLFSKDDLNKAVAEASSRVNDISFNRNGQILKVVVSERRPLALWCQGVRSDKSCFFLDKMGGIISSAPVFSDHVMIEFFSASATAKIQDRPLTDLDPVSFIALTDKLSSLVNSQLKNQSKIDFIEPLGRGDFALHFISSRSNNWFLLLNKKLSAETILGNLQATLDSTAFKVDAKNSGSLLYIDTRFDKKVFYKFQ